MRVVMFSFLSTVSTADPARQDSLHARTAAHAGVERDVPTDSGGALFHQSHPDVIHPRFGLGVEAGSLVFDDDAYEPVFLIAHCNDNWGSAAVLHGIDDSLLKDLESRKSNGDRRLVVDPSFDDDVASPQGRHLIGELFDRCHQSALFHRGTTKIHQRVSKTLD